MSKFNLYANYYDLLYQDKAYKKEVSYILQLISQYSGAPVKSLLDLGCGTGIHANLLAENNLTVDGVDLSQDMIDRAIRNFSSNEKLNFFCGNIQTFRNNSTYDVVTSLFHVMSYQNTNEELLSAMQTAAMHLEKNGLFVFDFWYGPGVLTDPPVKRTKELNNDDISVVRYATSELRNERNVVDVNYEIQIQSKDAVEPKVIREKHSMRYLFRPELEFFLKESGFKLVAFHDWMTTKSPSLTSWNVVAIAQKI